MQARLPAQMLQHRKSRRDALQARLNVRMSRHPLPVWAVLGLCCVALVGYVLHRGLYIGKHMDYSLGASYECNQGGACAYVPGYQLYCKYWTVHGTLRESGGFAYPTYDEAAEHSYCRMFRI
jgi:hypothetical protein